MKRLVNGLTLSIIFGIIFTILRNTIDKYLYLPYMPTLFPIIFLSYILILIFIGFYLKNPIFGIFGGIFSLYSKYITEITRLSINNVPQIYFLKGFTPPLDFENLNILLSPIIFSIISFFFLKVKGKKGRKFENPFISLILLISLFFGFFLNYYYTSYSIYVLPLATFILGIISLNIVLSLTSGIFFATSYTFFNLLFFEFKGDLNLMFENPITLIPSYLIYLFFVIIVSTLSSYPIYKIFSYLKEIRISGKLEREELKEKEETPALPQEEQSGNAKGGNDEKVRDDGDLQTKSL
jgi:hypothetical protein